MVSIQNVQAQADLRALVEMINPLDEGAEWSQSVNSVIILIKNLDWLSRAESEEKLHQEIVRLDKLISKASSSEKGQEIQKRLEVNNRIMLIEAAILMAMRERSLGVMNSTLSIDVSHLKETNLNSLYRSLGLNQVTPSSQRSEDERYSPMDVSEDLRRLEGEGGRAAPVKSPQEKAVERCEALIVQLHRLQKVYPKNAEILVLLKDLESKKKSIGLITQWLSGEKELTAIEAHVPQILERLLGKELQLPLEEAVTLTLKLRQVEQLESLFAEEMRELKSPGDIERNRQIDELVAKRTELWQRLRAEGLECEDVLQLKEWQEKIAKAVDEDHGIVSGLKNA